MSREAEKESLSQQIQTTLSYEELRRRDLAYLWHPYTEISSFEQTTFPIVESAQGCRLREIGGRELLDGISSWWCVNLGHSHPRLVRAIQEQAAKLQHTLLGGMSHPPAILLAERLAQIAPKGLGHAMFASDGSCAVEAALKIALQYWTNQGETQRTRFVTLEDGYHGDTLGTIGVGYIEGFHRPFLPALRPALAAVAPYCNRCPVGLRPENCHAECFDANELNSMEAILRRHHAECAAVIVEPLCQAAAGMRIYPALYLQRLRALCTEYGIPLIVDEVAVGFGRTGAMFACDKAGIVPDILTLGKGLTGGLLPMSAALVTEAIYDTFRAKDGQARTFFHGHTFCGNPLTSALALAALETYEEEKIVERLPERVRILEDGMRRVAGLLGSSPLRTLGMIAAIEIEPACGGQPRARKIAARACELGLFIRSLGSTIYLWPPLNTDPAELQSMVEILERATGETA
jgi:adenosylmethionine-8-amino-7-oxononanoate aminotransferase